MGPNSLVPLMEDLVIWRAYLRVVMWDYAKCYNSVKTTDKKLHCQRFVWRWSASESWKVFGIDAMHIGGRCAAIELDVVKKRVARAGKHIDEAAARMIKRLLQ